jgi:hypothetical protein
MKSSDLPTITAMLRHHPWSKEAVDAGYIPVLHELDVDPDRRAREMLEDMEAIGFDWPIGATCCSEQIVLSHYEIPGSDFGRLDDDDVPEVRKVHGSGLNWGSLIRLSKACEIGRKYFGESWPTRFKKQLLNPKDHLAFIEELLWLNLWYGLTDLVYEAKPFEAIGCRKQVDWQFKSCGYLINLEIKYRPKDWMRHVDGSEFNIVMPNYYYDVPGKFPRKMPDTLNLVGVSTPAPVDRSLCERTEIFLRSHPTIDGILIWSQSSKGDLPFEIHAINDRELIQTLFTGGDIEDAAHIGIVRHLWRDRDEKRAYRADEVPALLEQISAEVKSMRCGSSTNGP